MAKGGSRARRRGIRRRSPRRRRRRCRERCDARMGRRRSCAWPDDDAVQRFQGPHSNVFLTAGAAADGAQQIGGAQRRRLSRDRTERLVHRRRTRQRRRARRRPDLKILALIHHFPLGLAEDGGGGGGGRRHCSFRPGRKSSSGGVIIDYVGRERRPGGRMMTTAVGHRHRLRYVLEIARG